MAKEPEPLGGAEKKTKPDDVHVTVRILIVCLTALAISAMAIYS